MIMVNARFSDLGLIDYEKCLSLQEELFSEAIAIKGMPDTSDVPTVPDNYMIFCEHPHVYTLGKSGKESNLLLDYLQLKSKEARFFKTNRGGDITYHGPGQIVGYPVIDLEQFGMSLKNYIYNIEESIIRALKVYGIRASRMEKAAGVWLNPDTPRARKICAIGVRSSRYITMHGFAFNVNTDLNYFNYINPCGFTDKAVTSLARELGALQDMDKVKETVKKKFCEVFDMDLKEFSSFSNRQAC